MVIGISQIQDRLTLAQARRHPLLTKEDGRPPDLSSIHRWAFRGVRGHKLRIIRIGGRIFTTEQDIADFIYALNAPGNESSGHAKRDRVDAARKRLARDGVE